MKKKAVCLLSGGLDSTVTAYIAKNDGYDIYPLSFLYGQRHKKEIQTARLTGKELTKNKHVFFTLDLSQFGGSSLFESNDATIQDVNTIEDVGKEIPSTYVPARNTVFLSIALAYAETIDASAIFIGVTAADYSGYPDCRPEYINAYQQMANIATKKGVEQGSIHIETPLLHLSKAQIISQGHTLKVPFEHTWSCYRGGKKACGTCDSCLLRLKGFKEAGLIDPLTYQRTPSWYDQTSD